MDVKDIILQVTAIIRKYLSDEYRLILFGSFAKGNNLSTSDIDIGIVGKEKVSYDTLIKIKTETDNISTLRTIDIVDLLTVDELYRSKVLSTGKELIL